MTPSKDQPAFPCPVGTKPAPCPRLDRIRLSETPQLWPSPARPRCRTCGASPACAARAPHPGAVWVPWPCSHSAFSLSQQCATSNVPVVSTPGCSQCAGEPSSSDGVSLMYGWGEGQESSTVWAIYPFWPLPLLLLFLSFPRKAWDRHGASASYQARDSRLPSNSLKIAGELRKAEIGSRFKGFVVSKGQPQRHRLLKTLCDFQEKLRRAQSMFARFPRLPREP